MAIIQLPQQRSAMEGLMSGLGTGLGSGISSGINNIVDLKLQNLVKQQKQKNLEQGLASIVGPEKAPLYAALGVENPQVLNTLIKEGMQTPSQRFYEETLAGKPAQQTTEPQAPEIPGMQEVAQQLPQEAMQKEVTEMPVQKMPSIIKEPKEKALKPMVAQPKLDIASKLNSDIDRYKQAIASGKLRPVQIDKLSKEITKKENTLAKLVINKEKEKSDQKKFERSQALKEESFKLQEKKHLSKLDAEERKEIREKQEKIDKKYTPELDKIINQAEASSTDKSRLLEMKRINEEGDLGSNTFNILVDALQHGPFGMKLDLTSLQTADAQAMQKLSKDFMKNIKETIGTSKITQAEVLLYLQTIPNLMQSKEGRARVIGTNLLLNDLKEKKADIANDIIKKNNGLLPDNFKLKLHEKMKPFVNKLQKDFKSVAKLAQAQQQTAIPEKKAESSGLISDITRGIGQIAGAHNPVTGAIEPVTETLIGKGLSALGGAVQPTLKRMFPWF